MGDNHDDPFASLLPEDDRSRPFDAGDESEANLAEAFGIPDRLPPIRLPDSSELAEAARASRMLRQARDLARWVGDGRQITDDDELLPADAAAAAAALELPPPMRDDVDGALPGMPDAPAVHHMRDIPALLWLWRLAEAVEFLGMCTDHVHVAEDLDDWDDDDVVLGVWAGALGFLCAASLPLDAEIARVKRLDFDVVGVIIVIMLFLARDEGAELTELRELVRESVVDGMSAGAAKRAWTAWLRSHADPTDVFLARLEELGAAEIVGESVRLTPLGAWTVRRQLIEAGVEIPLLPPTAEMTAADLLAASEGLSEDELSAECTAWLAARTPNVAATELLDAAATSVAAERMLAVSIVTELGAAAEESWRKALTRPEIRPYARMALTNISDPESASPVPGFEPELGDVAWLLTDVLAATDDEPEAEAVVDQFRQAVPAGEEDAIFDAMWRQPHPDVHQVLTRLGRELPDKDVAKAARRAAFRAANSGPR